MRVQRLAIASGSATRLPTVVYTGASGRYQIDSAGVYHLLATGTLRSAHYPVLGGPPCILIEPAGTNVLTSPQNLGASWTLAQVTAARTAVGADGLGNTASTVRETAVTNVHTVAQAVTFTANTKQGVSVVLKPQGRDFCQFQVSDGTNTFGREFQFSTLAVSTDLAAGTGVTTSARIIQRGLGYYELHLVGTCGGAVASGTLTLAILSAAGTTSYAGDITKGCDIWMVQHLRDKKLVLSPFAGARVADLVTQTISAKQQAATFYLRFMNTQPDWDGNGVFAISGPANQNPKVYFALGATGLIGFNTANTAGTVVGSASAILGAVYGDVVEALGWLYADGHNQVFTRVNGGSTWAGNITATNPFDGAGGNWASGTLFLDFSLTGFMSAAGIQAWAVMPQVGLAMDAMLAVAGA